MTKDQQEAMQALVEAIKLPRHEIKVFGTIRCNIDVKCVSRLDAHHWSHMLREIFPKGHVSVIETIWPATVNKITNGLNAQIAGFLISIQGPYV